MSDEEYIKVDHVSKWFEHPKDRLHILNDVTFSVKKGEIVCIVGASGCGKSTLLRCILGLEPEHDGTITVNGEVVTKPKKNRGIVFQEHRLFPWMTVSQNIGFALTGVEKTEAEELIKKHINLVRLEGFENAYPKALSGGMLQRAGIARALVNNPPVLLLDEPFGALDAFTKITMQQELKRIQQESGTTMLMVTHDIDEAVYLADKVIVFSARPGSIKDVVDINLPKQRDRNSIEFLNVRKRIYDEFFTDK